jgi:O-antigen ligase
MRRRLEHRSPQSSGQPTAARTIAVAQFDLTDFRNTTAGEGVDLDTLIRTVLLAAVFLVLWISFQPFASLAGPPELAEAGQGNLFNQVGYSLLFLALAGWSLAHHPARLLVLVRPILIASLLWIVLSVLNSWEPALAARRFTLTLIAIAIAGMAMLLPKNVRHFGDVMAAVVLVVLALCYLGVLFAPSLSIHQSTDLVEPELAGDWRGLFVHKNDASATMALFVFIGLFVGRVRSAALGGVIAILASVFLIFTHSKTSIAMLPVVLIVSAIMPRVRSRVLGIAVALSGIALFNLISLGSLYFEPLRNFLDLVLADATFTGRTDVWQFVLDHIKERPILGYGFWTFWGSPEVVYGMGGYAVWANTAGHAHNGFLDIALTIGIPGAILVVLWLVVTPLADFYSTPRDPYAGPLATLFLQVCLFMAYESCFEAMLLKEGGASLFLFAATFGLRFLSVSRVAR